MAETDVGSIGMGVEGTGGQERITGKTGLGKLASYTITRC